MSLFLISNLSEDALTTIKQVTREDNCTVFIGEASEQLISGQKPLPTICSQCYIVIDKRTGETPPKTIESNSSWTLIDTDQFVQLTVTHSPIISL